MYQMGQRQGFALFHGPTGTNFLPFGIRFAPLPKSILILPGGRAVKYWEPQTVRNRHFSIMEKMVAQPHMTQNQLAEQMGYTPSRFSIIVNSPLFKFAFESYRRSHMEKISDLVVEATTSALKFSKAVVENVDVETPLRQVSAKDILGLGHAKAVDRTASLTVSAQVPAELLESLRPILEEVAQPFTPKRFFIKPPEKDEVSESDVSQTGM
jgi:hypothetical protein